MRSKQELAKLLMMEPKTAYGDYLFSSLDTLKSSAKKLVKPENYTVLTDGKKFMMTTNNRAKQFEKEGAWTIIGSILPNHEYKTIKK